MALAHAVTEAGADVLNTGIGWHEARVPTIVTSVPRAAFAYLTAKLRPEVAVPVIASNRINTPEVAEAIPAEGQADMISMARPFLADPDFVAKAARGEAARIAPCIACNQACLDHTFTGKLSSCLANPRACHETELVLEPVSRPRRIAVIGAGPAGLSAALAAAERGHAVTLFDKAERTGGQLHYAAAIPGKEEFRGLIDWFEAEIAASAVDLRPNHARRADELTGIDEVFVATGVRPRDSGIPGQEGPNVVSYADLLSGRVQAGPRVAVVGAGGIGFDVAEYLVTGDSTTLDAPAWRAEWSVADPAVARGGLAPEGPRPDPGDPPGDAVAAQGREAGQAAWQDHRLGASRRAADARRRDAGRHELRANRRAGAACHHPRGAAADRSRHHRALRGLGERADAGRRLA